MTRLFLKITFVTAILFISQASYAQITLEHTFNGNVSFNYGIVDGVGNFLSESGTTYPDNNYYITEIDKEKSSYSIKTYNPDYSLNINQTYYFPAPEGYELNSVSISRKLFNSDENFEFVVTFYKKAYNGYDNTYSKMLLCNESGEVLKDFEAGASIYLFPTLHIINNQRRLSVTRSIYDEKNKLQTQTEIYSIEDPGFSNIQENKLTPKTVPAYPNPASTIINLPYTLKQGEFNVMNIFTSQGQLVEQKQIGYDFNKILLNVSNYAKGVYFYEVNGISNKFIVE